MQFHRVVFVLWFKKKKKSGLHFEFLRKLIILYFMGGLVVRNIWTSPRGVWKALTWRMNLRGCSWVHGSPGLSSPVCSGDARAPCPPACGPVFRCISSPGQDSRDRWFHSPRLHLAPAVCSWSCLSVTKHAAHWHPWCMGRQRGHQGACRVHAVTLCLTRVLTSLLSSPEHGSRPGSDS